MAEGSKGLKLAACYRTDKGMVRRVNQDSVYCSIGRTISVFCVADGMGGHVDGEVASQEVIRAVKAWVEKERLSFRRSEIVQAADAFEMCLSMANDRIYGRYSGREISGTTVAALLIWEKQYAAFSVGDSRVYRKRGFSFHQITRDDVWQNLPESVRMQEAGANLREHPDYGKLTKTIGNGKPVIPFRVTGELKKGDMFLVCSDGIYKACGEDSLRRMCSGSFLLHSERALGRRVDRLCEEVCKNGAADNYSVVLIKAY